MMLTTNRDTIAEKPGIYYQSALLRSAAWIVSILLHPLFIPLIAIAYLAYVQQGYFMGVSSYDKKMLLLRVATNTIFFPLVTVLLLKGVGFIRSVLLKTQRERVIPYVATNIFYFWMFLVFKNQPEVPQIVTAFSLGVFLSSSLALILNSFFKISMHALGMGAFCGLMLVIIFSGFPYSAFLPSMLVFLLTGIVCTARMILGSHSLFDIQSGLLVGILTQFIAYAVYV